MKENYPHTDALIGELTDLKKAKRLLWDLYYGMIVFDSEIMAKINDRLKQDLELYFIQEDSEY
jgi:hypothetical protein